METATLEGDQLDHFTGLALGIDRPEFKPSSDPRDARPVLLLIRTLMHCADRVGDWQARADGCGLFARGPTPEIAICRALVLAKIGTRVELPEPDYFA